MGLAGISGTEGRGGEKCKNRKCTEDNRGCRLNKCAESCIPTLDVDVHSHWRTEGSFRWAGSAQAKGNRGGKVKRLKPVSIGSGALVLSDLQAVQVLQSQLIAEPVLLLPTTARPQQFL